MPRRQNALDAALAEAGAELVRQGNHRIFRLPNGRTFVCGKTPSDRRAEQNALRELRKCLR